MEKLYVVVRSDIPPGAQCAQACHGLRAFVALHPELDKEWYENSNNLVVLQAGSEDELYALADRAFYDKIPYATFIEPDFDDEMTAVALGYAGQKLVSNLPLALKEKTAEA